MSIPSFKHQVLKSSRRLALPIAVHPGLALTGGTVREIVTNPRAQAAASLALRDRLRTPALLVSGSRDGFGTTEELTSALKLIPARTRLVTVASAGHELMTKGNREGLPTMVVEEFRAMFPA